MRNSTAQIPAVVEMEDSARFPHSHPSPFEPTLFPSFGGRRRPSFFSLPASTMRNSTAQIPAVVEMEDSARAESHSRGAKAQRRSTAQIHSSRRAKKTTLITLRPNPNLGSKSRAVSRVRIPSRRGLDDVSKKQLRAVSRAHIIIPSRRGLDDSDKKQLRAGQVSRAHIIPSRRGFDDSNKKPLRPVCRARIISSRQEDNCASVGARNKRRRCCLLPPDDYDNTKRRRYFDDDEGIFSGFNDLPCPPEDNWRDWINLAEGPAGLIAERVLAYDVADYLRFRAVCRPWRQCSTEPRSLSALDRRFHPWRWTMLQDELAAPDRRCFLNTFTGESLQVDIPELCSHELLAVTPEGLLVLVHERMHIRLLNPLTRHLTELPPLTTLLPPKNHNKLSGCNSQFLMDFVAWGSGIANDDSTFVLCFSRLSMIGIAKPGDDQWTLLKYCCGTQGTPLMFAGRFYCVSLDGLMVLETGADQPPRLEVAAEMDMHVSSISDSLHLVNNYGELMLVHGQRSCCYDIYRVDLDTGTLFPAKSLGGGTGRAVFLGMYRSLLTSLDGFPAGSISADTIYLNSEVSLDVRAYHLPDGSTQCTRRYNDSLVPRPHSLVDCLCLSVTV